MWHCDMWHVTLSNSPTKMSRIIWMVPNVFDSRAIFFCLNSSNEKNTTALKMVKCDPFQTCEQQASLR